VLLHLTSLPGPGGLGDLGAAARAFAERIGDAGFSIWQTLPVHPVGPGNSPYSPRSAFAGEPMLLSLQDLADEGLVPRTMARRRAGTPGRTDWRAARRIRREALDIAWDRFHADGGERDPRFKRFLRRESAWLPTWSRLGGRRGQTPEQLAFEQFLFDRQWKSLRTHARRCGVHLVGDLPIFVPLESVDVQGHPELFRLDAEGLPTVVTGVPPDAFSRSGQLWNHPHYRWTSHRRTGFDWWIERIARQLRLFDAVRIDHFIGFHRAYEVKAGARDARSGRWGRSPGDELLRAARRRLGPMPLFAEDLGAVTREVIALRDRHGLPGMRILQNAFGSPDSSDLPANHPRHAVVYTGTHDNAPLRGWWRTLDPVARRRAEGIAGTGDPVKGLVDVCFRSHANTAIVPAQDLLGLGSVARMNRPGTPRGNWTWRLPPAMLPRTRVRTLRTLLEESKRL
tara:strand:- start:37024 stop:38385 length:1362 start_codon:yes stop_codon:yes gene_type:complete